MVNCCERRLGAKIPRCKSSKFPGVECESSSLLTGNLILTYGKSTTLGSVDEITTCLLSSVRRIFRYNYHN